MKMQVVKLEAIDENTAKITGVVSFNNSGNLPKCLDNVEIKTGYEGANVSPDEHKYKRSLRTAVQLLQRATFRSPSENPGELENTVRLFLNEMR